MKFVLLIIGLLFCLSGCGLLRNSSKSVTETSLKRIDQSDSKFLQEKEVSTALNTIGYFEDTVNHDYEVQIWPKGNFSFSKDKGFVGHAERIHVKGKSGNLRKIPPGSLWGACCLSFWLRYGG